MPIWTRRAVGWNNLADNVVWRVDIAEWANAERAIRSVRETVFIREQHVPAELEWDGLDPVCVHVLARSEAGDPIGTARLQSDGKIGRMAVLKEWRGRGVGQALLQTLLAIAASRRLTRVILTAQTHAIGFYEKAGFRALGDFFLDAGITHRMMILDLHTPGKANH